ncbi:MAG: phosphatidate cytidylyltransferase [Clostridia bacterium]|nr:phosphatidate cytidylyltransferase [Clostridia bacterium]
MAKRLLTGIILLAVLIPVLIFGDTAALPALFAVISVVSLYETAKCAGADKGKNLKIMIPVYIIAVVFPFFEFFTENKAVSILMAAGALAAFAVFFYHVVKFGKAAPISQNALILLMLIYVVGASSSAVSVAVEENGVFLVPLIIICSWGTDIFAYVFGSLFGRHKLSPTVSPKKSIEGSVGGTVMAAALTVAYGAIVSHFTSLSANYAALFVTGVLISVISQMGDLNASAIKRSHNVKDFGKIFPGHGGMLDRFDSVIAACPALYIISLFFTYFS